MLNNLHFVHLVNFVAAPYLVYCLFVYLFISLIITVQSGFGHYIHLQNVSPDLLLI